MIKAFIWIRLKQFQRAMTGLGLFRIIFLTGLLGFVLYLAFVGTSAYPGSLYVSGLTALLIWLIHTKRQDKSFLRTNFSGYKLIILVEYSILAAIILVFQIIHFQWIPFLLLAAGLPLVIHVDVKTGKRNLNTRLQQWIPPECFEWKAGVRNSLFLMAALWIMGIGASFLIGSVPIVLFILGILPFSFYEKGEPYQMILAGERGTNRFLFQKIKIQVSMFSVLALPLIAAFLVFHADRWYIPVAEYLIFISLYVYLILAKYAFYEPNRKSPAAQIFGAVGVCCGLLPVFLPVVWLLSVRFYFQSKENLKIYLDDYN